MHAVALATELGCRTVIVPRGASVFSAWGMMMSDLRRDSFVTRLIPESEDAHERLTTVLGETADEARAQFAAEGVPAERLTLTALVKSRYRNQEHAVEVPVGLGPHGADAVADLYARFHGIYEREYTYRLDAPVECCTDDIDEGGVGGHGRDATPTRGRKVMFTSLWQP